MPNYVDIQRVNMDSSGGQLQNGSAAAIFVPGSNKVIFQATDAIGADDTNGQQDLFLKDLDTGVVTRISLSSTGGQTDLLSNAPSISADGNMVVFESRATNLTAGDTLGKRDIFVKNLTTGEVKLVSSADDNIHYANGNSTAPVISQDGTKVVFTSVATNLDSVDVNTRQDVYVKDLITGDVSLVSGSLATGVGNATSSTPVFSPDGTKVAFQTGASNLISGDTNGANDIYIKDLVTGAFTRVSVGATGAQIGSTTRAYDPVFSPDGTQLLFRTEAGNLVSNGVDTNGFSDVYIKNLVTGAVTLVSTDVSGHAANGASAYASFSHDGTKVVFSSTANTLVNDFYQALTNNVFVKDLTTGAVTLITSTPANGTTNGDSISPVFSADDSKIMFLSTASNLVSGDTNAQMDVFVVTLNGNQAPVANADTLTANEGDVLSDLNATLLANDTDKEHNPLTITGIGTNGTLGTASFDAVTGKVSYAADTATLNALAEGEKITDTFTYKVTDGHGSESSATVSVVLTGKNDAPVAVDDHIAVTEDQSVVISIADLLANDTDPDHGAVVSFAGRVFSPAVVNPGGGVYTPLHFVVTPLNGTLTYNENGTYTYQPNANFNGTDSFTYAIKDEFGATSQATVYFDVASVNDAPVVADDSASVTVGGATDNLVPLLLSNDSDVEGSALVVSSVHGNPAHGTLAFSAADQTLSFTPNASYFANLAEGEEAIETFTYTAKDAGGAQTTATVSVTVTGINDAPEAADNNVDVVEDVAKVITIAELLGNDHDVDHDAIISFGGILTQPAHGTLTDNGDGTFTYLSHENYNGNDSFTYTIHDDFGATSSATVSLAVAAVNDAPVAHDDTISVDDGHDTVINPLALLANDSDVDAGALITIDSIGLQPTHGSVTLNTDGTLTYSAEANYHGTDSFTYAVRDEFGALSSAVVNVNVLAANVNPVAHDDTLVAKEDIPLVITLATLLANDHDADAGDVIAFDSISVNPLHGSVSLNDAGDLVYLSAANYFGADSFSYRISDGQGGFSDAIVTLDVQSQDETITGTENPDLLYGTSGNDFIDALQRNDTVYALEGDDTVHAGTGNDIVYAGAGNDSVLAGAGDDTLYGGVGDDYLSGGLDNDSIFGEDGIDILFGAAGDDVLYGGNGDDFLGGDVDEDLLFGEGGNDRLAGDEDNDTLYGGTGLDALSGGTGDDLLHGDEDDDRLRGDDGNDKLYGDAGNDNMDGGAGDDMLAGGAGSDSIRGGAGADTFRFLALTDSTTTTTLRDTIYDYTDGVDHFDVSGLGFTGIVRSGVRAGATDLTVSYSAAADKTYIRDTHSDFQFALTGNHLTEIESSDFTF
jgi:VCBS repeat-containing protein